MWDLNYITYFQFDFTNSGLSLTTWLGDFDIPMRTFVLLVGVLVALRIRKRVRDVLNQRKQNQVTPFVPPVTFDKDFDF